LDWLPHGGDLYATWAELTDLYETGKTPISDAHVTLREAATEWLTRAGDRTEASIEAWSEHTRTTVTSLFDRDGTFWGPKE
jgi:hypothetical protein